MMIRFSSASWYDNPRDLFLMINHFGDQISRPLVGIGHSYGGNNLTMLSIMHPTLFTTLVLIDPVISKETVLRAETSPAFASSKRRDIWPSRQVAREAFLKSKFYQAWDRRVFDRWIEHGLRDLPTKVHPGQSGNSSPSSSSPSSSSSHSSSPSPSQPVTLRTTKHQEVFTFFRPSRSDVLFNTTGLSPQDEQDLEDALFADRNSEAERQRGLYLPEAILTYHYLPFLRPSVFYVFGAESAMSIESARRDKLATTGIGPGGSGGQARGRVSSVVMADTGHLIPMDKPVETASRAAAWLGSELGRYARQQRLVRRLWVEQTPLLERYTLSPRRLEVVAQSVSAIANAPDAKTPVGSKTSKM